MSGASGIEWTDWTWNPVTGCTPVSTGCDHCYAATLSRRLLRDQYTSRLPVVDTPERRQDPFSVRLWPERLNDPVKETRPRRIFVNSMSDLFHADIPAEYVRRIFEAMLEADWHVYQVLTKRPARAARFWEANRDLFDGGPFPAHVWIGTSVENQGVAHRVRHLRSVPAVMRFLSCEPLLGPLELQLDGIDWVIAGGESGPVRRPLDMDWVRGIRDTCLAHGVAFFFKQVGGRTPKAGGRLLDGRTWDEYPAMSAAPV